MGDLRKYNLYVVGLLESELFPRRQLNNNMKPKFDRRNYDVVSPKVLQCLLSNFQKIIQYVSALQAPDVPFRFRQKKPKTND